MTDRDRLIELIVNADVHDSYECKLCTRKDISCVRCGAEKFADYLLANGVIVPVRCENCKHLTIHNSPTLYAYCEKTHYRFEPFKTDTRTNFCGFGELKEREGK